MTKAYHSALSNAEALALSNGPSYRPQRCGWAYENGHPPVSPDLKQVKKNVKSRTRSDTDREGSAVTEGDQRTSKGAGSAKM
jgi:hypothetical protein